MSFSIAKDFIKLAFRSFLVGAYFSSIHYCVSEHVCQLVECSGPSMEPTISTSNVVVCEHLSPLFRDYNLGDIVISKSVYSPTMNVCKRVTGIAGDVLWTGEKFVRVPQGHVWLQGDNTEDSNDSRDYGPVPQALIRGRVAFRIWPLNQIRSY